MINNSQKTALARTAVAVLALVLWSSQSVALNADDQRHLVLRTGFGASAAIAAPLELLDREAAVEHLIGDIDFSPKVAPPDWVSEPLPPRKTPPELSASEAAVLRRTRNKDRRARRKAFQSWYLSNAIASPSPLAERLVLFWHNVFTVELKALPDPLYLWQQQEPIRQHGAGDYRELVREMALNPAMLVYLDNHKNHRKRPNENYARELMELHTLGEGHFTEQDVRELGRTLTGARPNLTTAQYAFNENWHDTGDKTVFGKTGPFKPEDAASIALAHPRAARYPVERLWREFVSETLDETAIDRLTSVFVDNDWKIKPLLRAMLLEDAFWSEANRRQLVRSPIELVVGLHQETDLSLSEIPKWLRRLELLGQDLFNPPDVAGWPGGLSWISTSSLSRRQTVIERAGKLSGADPDTLSRWLALDYQLK